MAALPPIIPIIGSAIGRARRALIATVLITQHPFRIVFLTGISTSALGRFDLNDASIGLSKVADRLVGRRISDTKVSAPDHTFEVSEAKYQRRQTWGGRYKEVQAKREAVSFNLRNE
ncbi:hypothetical protein [Granulicella sp. L60]|uniref:hypothetical protein n=1 Tax=Granulicella sp. L60 TaxID=1641866 RepID=UPI00131C6D50|nr:hypothetical protein [Granulicella sp. L60]